MTTETASLITPGVDFYTFIHKSFRARLFEASVTVGRTDWSNSDHADSARAVIEQLFADLKEHAAHESEFWHPLIARVNPDALRSLEAEHAGQDREMEGMQVLLTQAANGDLEAGQEFYRAFNAFIGDFLLHLAEEETGNPLLWSAYREGQLGDAYNAFRLSLPLEESLRYLETMLPVMNRQERAMLFASMAGAPPPVVEALRALVLGEDAWAEAATGA
jgi:hypothetical protein